ncbi:MAG: tRNA (N6-threonylcarbamoyladenosine(37)-N6)-methyltransferase TrmO [Deltaproteobacteria bacterium]|nr:MAG: tRNA (N6-threonylcarbamoyladenosine(37)-N6)-methyltransferase TrmO [Deltaproteobacteria bacterium]
MKIEYQPIGIIHSPYKTPQGVPLQPTGGEGIQAVVEVFPKYVEGLADLEGFSHIFLLYHFHLAGKFSLRLKPFLDDQYHGVFATRAPARPNPIGLSIVRLMRLENDKLYVQDTDIVDQTPLLDIKPYIPEFDVQYATRLGWLEGKLKKLKEARADERFSK